jgi:hypothetical protein
MHNDESNVAGKKVLPIGEDPFIRPYAEYVFYDSIMNNPYRTGKTVAQIEVSDFDKAEWSFYPNEDLFSLGGNRLEVFKNEDLNSDTRICRPLHSRDCLEFGVDYQQYSNRWDDIHFFVSTKDDVENCIKDLFSFARVGGEIIKVDFKGQASFISYNKYSGRPYRWLKAVVNEGKVLCEASVDRADWDTLYEAEIALEDGKEYVCGINFDFSDSQYYKWIFNNFIQLRFAPTETVKLIYTDLVRRDFRIYTVNPVIKCSTVKRKMLDELNIDLVDFICSSIDNDRYIEFWLNEKYLHGQDEFGVKDFDHESLVYGYNKAEKTFNLISIKGGKPRYHEASFSSVLESYKKSGSYNDFLYSFEYNPTDSPYEYDFPHIFARFEDYLIGENPTEEYAHVLPKESGEFGVDLYDAILNDEDNVKIFLEDKKLPYLFSEHKKVMLERIKFLNREGFFSREDSERILKLAEEIYIDGQLVISFALKNIATPSEAIQKKIWKYMKEAKEKEIQCYKAIINNVYIQ